MGLLAVTAIVGAVGAVGSAVIKGSANSRAARQAEANAAANNALSQRQYDTTRGMEQPIIDRGNQAGDALQGFLGLGGDPAKTQAAFQHYLDSTGYQFNRQQGIDAATQSAAGQGLLNSGGALKALQDRGTGLANTYGQQYVGNLNDVATRGANGVNSLATFGNTNVTNQTTNNDQATGVRVGATTANGNLFGNAFGTVAGAASGLISGGSFGGGNRGASSFTPASNAFNQPGYAPFRGG